MAWPYPPPPWRLAGPCAAVTGLVAVAAVRHLVPQDLEIVQVRPGRTLGAIAVADYRGKATFPYGELAVMPALVRYRGTRGAWVSDIWVDSEPSLQGGRQLWGLPKLMASFTWEHTSAATRVTVQAADGPLGIWTWTPPHRRWPVPAVIRGVGSVDGDRRRYGGWGTARMGRPATLAFEPADDTPLAAVWRALDPFVWAVGSIDVRFTDVRILAPAAVSSAGAPAGRTT